MTLTTGIHGEQSVAVTNENTAKTMGSGTLDVFATPALVALAEKTCWMSVAEALDEGCGTVGTKLELEHTAPTPVGMTVTCESELVAVEGRLQTRFWEDKQGNKRKSVEVVADRVYFAESKKAEPQPEFAPTEMEVLSLIHI